jgi:hypothetical protein
MHLTQPPLHVVFGYGRLPANFVGIQGPLRHARNAYQHLDEAINRGHVVNEEDFTFSIHNILTFKDNRGASRTLDFSSQALARLPELWDNTVTVIRSSPEPNNDVHCRLASSPS